MSLSSSGLEPTKFWNKELRKLVGIINAEALRLESGLVKASPTGISSTLRQAWFVRSATTVTPVAEVANSQAYLLPVEMGRKPGSGISVAGQQSVAQWARVKLGLNDSKSKNFAYMLSRKYKREGKPAVGFIGLSAPGVVPSGSLKDNIEPVSGSMLDASFKRLRARLEAA